MPPAARLLLCATLLPFSTGCRTVFGNREQASALPVLGADALVPSSRLIVGRIIAVDPARGFAFVELVTDAPGAALIAGTQLIARTLDLRPTGKIEVSRYVRGRTLGTKVVGGQPSPGDEVVWLAP